MDFAAVRERVQLIQESTRSYGVFDLVESDVYWLIAQVRIAIFARNGFDARGSAERLIEGPCRHATAQNAKSACALCLEDALLEAFLAGAAAPREPAPADPSEPAPR